MQETNKKNAYANIHCDVEKNMTRSRALTHVDRSPWQSKAPTMLPTTHSRYIIISSYMNVLRGSMGQFTWREGKDWGVDG